MSIRLAAVLTAVGVSRVFVRQTLRAWRLDVAVDAAELIVSELVTNAVKSSGITDPEPKCSQIKGHHVVAVQLRVVGSSLFVEVWDRAEGRPAMQEQTLDAEGGRGLFLVEMVSERWDVYRPAVGGKIVWAELPLVGPVDVAALSTVLPQRVPGALGPIPGVDVGTADIALMQRALDGLRALPSVKLAG